MGAPWRRGEEIGWLAASRLQFEEAELDQKLRGQHKTRLRCSGSALAGCSQQSPGSLCVALHLKGPPGKAVCEGCLFTGLHLRAAQRRFVPSEVPLVRRCDSPCPRRDSEWCRHVGAASVLLSLLQQVTCTRARTCTRSVGFRSKPPSFHHLAS